MSRFNLVPVLSQPNLKAWPKHPEGGHVPYLELREALSRNFATDAHFACYSSPGVERRLDYGSFESPHIEQLGGCIPMVAAVFDVDAQESHKALGGQGDVPASDAWWLDELPKLEALQLDHPSPFIYRTRGGYRIVFRLDAPFELRNAQEARERWTPMYLTWIAYLRRQYSIVADPGCKDFGRIFRLPHATRTEGGRPEQR